MARVRSRYRGLALPATEPIGDSFLRDALRIFAYFAVIFHCLKCHCLWRPPVRGPRGVCKRWPATYVGLQPACARGCLGYLCGSNRAA